MHLYNPGRMDWADSQGIYHALADLGRECLCLVHPDKPFICLGFSQEPGRELDLDFCRQAGLPIFRREAGGGTVLLDQRQLFFQVVLKRDHPLVSPNRELFYRRLLEPVVRAYQRTGVAAQFQPLNDIAVGERKISGTGAGEIGDCVVFVGNIIIDFDTRLMARVVRSPDRRFQERVRQLMARGIGSLTSELGAKEAQAWNHDRLTGLLREEFAKLLGPLVDKPLDDELTHAMAKRREQMLSPAWLNRRGRRVKGRRVKIRAGLELVQRNVPTRAGEILARYEAHKGRIYGLELVREGVSLDRATLEKAKERLKAQPEADLETILVGSFGTPEGD